MAGGDDNGIAHPTALDWYVQSSYSIIRWWRRMTGGERRRKRLGNIWQSITWSISITCHRYYESPILPSIILLSQTTYINVAIQSRCSDYVRLSHCQPNMPFLIVFIVLYTWYLFMIVMRSTGRVAAWPGIFDPDYSPRYERMGYYRLVSGRWVRDCFDMIHKVVMLHEVSASWCRYMPYYLQVSTYLYTYWVALRCTQERDSELDLPH